MDSASRASCCVVFFFFSSPSSSSLAQAKVFSKVGKRTPTFARFSTVGGERGSADTARDPRGFAIKHFTSVGRPGRASRDGDGRSRRCSPPAGNADIRLARDVRRAARRESGTWVSSSNQRLACASRGRLDRPSEDCFSSPRLPVVWLVWTFALSRQQHADLLHPRPDPVPGFHPHSEAQCAGQDRGRAATGIVCHPSGRQRAFSFGLS